MKTVSAFRAREVELRPVVSPAFAAVASVLPGFGQALCRQYARGFLILSSVGSIVGLLAWRVYDLAHREPDWFAMLRHAASRRPGFISLVVATLIAVWALNIWDAWRCAKTRRRGGPGVFLLIGLGFFALGWQISRIDPVRLVRDFPDAIPPLTRVLWPWQAAVTFPVDLVNATVPVAEGDESVAPARPAEVPGEPYLVATPNYGTMSSRDEQFRTVPGTRLRLEGRGFAPNTFTQIFWQDPLGNEFRPRQDGEYVAVTSDAEGRFGFELVMPYIITPTGAGAPIHRVEARQSFRTGEIVPSEALLVIIGRMIETIFMGMMATAFGIILSIPVSFLAARNIMSGSRVTLAIYYVTRLILNIIRSIEPLIWALIAVVWVGLGPFAGIVALTLHSVAALGKLYSEAIESIEHGPIEAIQATGATKMQTIMYAVIPQMISPFISFSIYRWDINVRMSTVIGLVGGGGIGFILVQYIRLLDYRSAGIAVWLIAVTVAVLDYVSAEIRAKML